MPNTSDSVLILASASPRRSKLLAREGVAFEVLPADIPEESREGEAPIDLARRLAFEKADAVARRVGSEPDRWVLGADTIVVIDDQVLGKPRDEAHAETLLGMLVGRTHSVITGFAFVDSARAMDRNAAHIDACESRVTMRPAQAEEIRSYVATGEPMDKAGAYAVQGGGAKFVIEVEGSLDNVIGLPVADVVAQWRRLGSKRS